MIQILLVVVFLIALVVVVVAVLQLQKRVRQVESRLEELQRRMEPGTPWGELAQRLRRPEQQQPVTSPVSARKPGTPETSPATPPEVSPQPPPVPVQAQVASTPKPPAAPAVEPESAGTSVPAPVGTMHPGEPTGGRALDWEQFLGVKLFAWIGGLVLFLGVAFLVKHSFEQGWISPKIRVLSGYVIGLALVVAGLRLPRARLAVLAQTLCATGTVILYGTTFGAHAFYDLIPVGIAFAVMVGVTVVAFALAVRLEAPVVAVLGLLAGFLTPPLLSTGVDRPLALFGYVALLDLGLAALAARQRWDYLVLGGAVATMFTQAGWAAHFLTEAKLGTGLTIFTVFPLLFAGMVAVSARLGRSSRFWDAAGLVSAAAMFAFVLMLLSTDYPTLAERGGLLVLALFLVDLGVWLMGQARPPVQWQYPLAGLAVFVLLSIWVVRFMTDAQLWLGLIGGIALGTAHTLLPFVWSEPADSGADGAKAAPVATAFVDYWPAVGLLLAHLLVWKTETLHGELWPAVLVLDLLAIGLAAVTARLLGMLAVLLLTALTTAVWIIRTPIDLSEAPQLLGLAAGVGIVFAVASVWLSAKMQGGWRALFVAAGDSSSRDEPTRLDARAARLLNASIPSAVLPFVLLSLVVLRLPLDNPSAPFAVGLLLVLLSMALARGLGVDKGLLPALLGLLVLQYFWHGGRFQPSMAGVALGWHLALVGVFVMFPFVFQDAFERRVWPWVTAALAGPLAYPLMHWTLHKGWPNFGYPGLLPLALGLPYLAGAVRLARLLPPEFPERKTILSWMAGASLLFVTLTVPVQFDREWLTLGWALEGAALLILLRRLPSRGLQCTGLALLGIAFVRLALNPAVFEYHERSGRVILNWWLYTYGVPIVALATGARALSSPWDKVGGVPARKVLVAMATILGFLLVNIEIADAFSTGRHLTFQFSAALGQDMTYSIAWGVFALGMVIAGVRTASRAARVSGMGLLVVTILKLFLHDLWRLGGLYRVGSLVGLAVVLILVSFLYQRFVATAAPGQRGGPSSDSGPTGTEEGRGPTQKP